MQNITHLNYSFVVADVFIFGSVADKADILRQHTVPINFLPQIGK